MTQRSQKSARGYSPTGIAVAAGALLLILLAAMLPERSDEQLVSIAPSSELQPAPGTGVEFGDYGVADLVDRDWAADAAAATGIPGRALLAYAGAEIAFRQDVPECRVDWATLAGIGYVESRHGTLQGGEIGADGRQTPEIFGIALDGESTAEVPDSDGGELDGDAIWDRAVGPLQFIPSTWAAMGADGNRDGAADPQNIDDASLAAARYLCRVGGDLSEPDNWISAVFQYNRSVIYNNEVANANDRYRDALSGF